MDLIELTLSDFPQGASGINWWIIRRTLKGGALRSRVAPSEARMGDMRHGHGEQAG